jgi:hypothetical protein
LAQGVATVLAPPFPASSPPPALTSASFGNCELSHPPPSALISATLAASWFW